MSIAFASQIIRDRPDDTGQHGDVEWVGSRYFSSSYPADPAKDFADEWMLGRIRIPAGLMGISDRRHSSSKGRDSEVSRANQVSRDGLRRRRDSIPSRGTIKINGLAVIG